MSDAGEGGGAATRPTSEDARSLFSTENIIAVTIGTALYAAIAIPFNVLNLPSVYLVSLKPAVAIPIAFGFLFGPIAGFFSGFLGGVITDQFSSGGFIWNWDLGYGLIGLIPALGYYAVKRQRSAEPIGLAACSVLAVIGSLAGTGFASLIDMVSQTGLSAALVASAVLVPAAVTDAVNGAVISPIIVYAYLGFSRRRTMVRSRTA